MPFLGSIFSSCNWVGGPSASLISKMYTSSFLQHPSKCHSGFLWEAGLFSLVNNRKHTPNCVSHFALSIRKLRSNLRSTLVALAACLESSGVGGAGSKWEEVEEWKGEQRSRASRGYNYWSVPQTAGMTSLRRADNRRQGYSNIQGTATLSAPWQYSPCPQPSDSPDSSQNNLQTCIGSDSGSPCRGFSLL